MTKRKPCFLRTVVRLWTDLYRFSETLLQVWNQRSNHAQSKCDPSMVCLLCFVFSFIWFCLVRAFSCSLRNWLVFLIFKLCQLLKFNEMLEGFILECSSYWEWCPGTNSVAVQTKTSLTSLLCLTNNTCNGGAVTSSFGLRHGRFVWL